MAQRARLTPHERATVVRTWLRTGSVRATAASVGGLAPSRVRETVMQAHISGLDCTPPSGILPVWLKPTWPMVSMRARTTLRRSSRS